MGCQSQQDNRPYMLMYCYARLYRESTNSYITYHSSVPIRSDEWHMLVDSYLCGWELLCLSTHNPDEF